ncbi:MAG: hypothetical protein EOP58_14085 [Sphingomonadales bacterium]|nr:MAG: hypothetical protein EOP58_14085 [Sphingomonadales bacterium]
MSTGRTAPGAAAAGAVTIKRGVTRLPSVPPRQRSSRLGTDHRGDGSSGTETIFRRVSMGKGILLWLLGIPIPIIILLLLFWR